MTDGTYEDEIVAALNELSGYNIQDNDAAVPSGMRPCPICGEKMQVERNNGVSIDVCPKHGMWLDNGELPAILAMATSARMSSRIAAIRQARRDGKVSALLYGAWSLLQD